MVIGRATGNPSFTITITHYYYKFLLLLPITITITSLHLLLFPFLFQVKSLDHFAGRVLHPGIVQDLLGFPDPVLAAQHLDKENGSLFLDWGWRALGEQVLEYLLAFPEFSDIGQAPGMGQLIFRPAIDRRPGSESLPGIFGRDGNSGQFHLFRRYQTDFASRAPLYRGPEDQLTHARNLADVRKFWESEQVLKDLLSQRPPSPIQEEASVLLVKVLSGQNRIKEAQQVLDDAREQYPASEMIQTFDLKQEGK